MQQRQKIMTDLCTYKLKANKVLRMLHSILINAQLKLILCYAFMGEKKRN